MKSILIDDETYAYIESNAKVYVDKNPGETIKRLLGLSGEDGEIDTFQTVSHNLVSISKNGKSPKTSLIALITSGYLKEGQTLTFKDYRGNLYPAFKVHIKQGDLVWNSKRYSMSELAKQILQKQGHSTDSVRGPVFWVTDSGKTVLEIWQEYLQKRGE